MNSEPLKTITMLKSSLCFFFTEKPCLPAALWAVVKCLNLFRAWLCSKTVGPGRFNPSYCRAAVVVALRPAARPCDALRRRRHERVAGARVDFAAT